MSRNYTWYPQVVWEVDKGTIPYEGDDIVNGCNEIYTAMKGWGSDKKALTSVLYSKTPTERYLIAKKYEKLYDETLYNRLKGELSGAYGRVMKLLSLPSEEAEAKMVRDALKGLGAREHLLFPILGARSNGDLTLLKKAYFKRYDRDLGKDLSNSLSGDFCQLMVMCAQGLEENYDPETIHNEERILEDMEIFYKAGEGKWGTNESKFFRILCISPPEHLKAVDVAYTKKYGNTMKKAVTTQLGGNAEDAAVYIVSVKLGDTPDIIASEIKKRTKGVGTDEEGLMNFIIRLIVVPDLFRSILSAHEKLFNKTLEKRISSEVTGNFEDILLKLVAYGRGADYE